MNRLAKKTNAEPRTSNLELRSSTRPATRFGVRCSVFSVRRFRFRESLLSLLRMHWDHEPVPIPLNRPPGTFSPTGGEGWDEGGTVQGKPPVLATSRCRRQAKPGALRGGRSAD